MNLNEFVQDLKQIDAYLFQRLTCTLEVKLLKNAEIEIKVDS